MAMVMPVTAIRQIIGLDEAAVRTALVRISHALNINPDISKFKIYLNTEPSIRFNPEPRGGFPRGTES
jgi:hypothetical protein